MTEYKKKKQLLEDNKDLYISDYDKTLSYDALKQITDAKRDYDAAYKANDTDKMQQSNNIANAVRAKYGSYTAGNAGDEYNPFMYGDLEFDDYSSRYDDELDRLYQSMSSDIGKFSYDYEADPVYKAYKSVYEKQGNLAYDRALAENSLRTGGMANTDAQTAAMQAQNYYNSMLAAKIPELYEAAYERYYDDVTRKYNRYKDAYDLINARENKDYQRHLDKLSNQREMRDYLYKQSSDAFERAYNREQSEAEREAEIEAEIMNNLYKAHKDKLDRESDSRELYYDIMRDAIADEKWRSEYNKDAYKKGYSPYRGTIGTGTMLDYARRIFRDNTLTEEDLQRLLGL